MKRFSVIFFSAEESELKDFYFYSFLINHRHTVFFPFFSFIAIKAPHISIFWHNSAQLVRGFPLLYFFFFLFFFFLVRMIYITAAWPSSFVSPFPHLPTSFSTINVDSAIVIFEIGLRSKYTYTYICEWNKREHKKQCQSK